MSETERPSTMKALPRTRSSPHILLRCLRAAGVSLVLTSVVGGTASAQTPARGTLVGTVTSPEGGPIPNVTVVVQGSDARAVTGGNGRYLIPNAPRDGVLRFTAVGRRSVETSISGRST